MPADWPSSHPNPEPAPKQEADAAGLRDNTESPTMRRNVLLLFWALYRLKCGDTVEVRRHAPPQHPAQPPSPSPEPELSPNRAVHTRARSLTPPALTPQFDAAQHALPGYHPHQVDAMSEQQLQRAKQLATKVLMLVRVRASSYPHPDPHP